MKRSLACSLALVLGMSAVPLLANSVYVPLAVNVDYDGVTYRTQMWLTNRGEDGRRVTTYHVRTDEDGTNRPDNAGDNTQIPAGSTVFVSSVTSSNLTGILEISGAPQVLVKAELASFLDGQRANAVEVPVLTPENTLPAGGTANLLPWERNDAVRTDFSLVNLGREATQCTVDLLGPDGETLIPTALLTVPPLSQRGFVDVLGAIGMSDLTAARASATCDQPFYAFLLQRNVEDGDLHFIRPARDVGSGFPDPTAPSECNASAAQCFQRDGIFHTPTPSNPVRRIEFPVQGGTYSRLHLEMDFRHGGWFPGRPNGLHNIIWLVQNARNRDMFAYLNFWGPGNNAALFRHGFNQPQEDKARLTAGATLTPGQTYHVDLVYDTAQRFIEVVVTNTAGQQVVRFRHVPNINNIRFGGNDTITADFGFVEGLNPNEPPTYGWDYMNLKIELYP